MAPVIPAPEPLAEVRRGRRPDHYKAKFLMQALDLPKSTFYELAGKGEIPCTRIGKRFKFPRSRLDPYLEEKGAVRDAA